MTVAMLKIKVELISNVHTLWKNNRNITAVEGSQIYWDVVNLSGATSCVNNIVVLDIICWFVLIW